jgi:hypothetical protein
MGTLQLLPVARFATPTECRSGAGGVGRVVLVALALGVGLAVLYVADLHGDISSLTCTGQLAGEGPYRLVTHSGGGYDGQFYYVIAQHPWQIQQEKWIDAPATRHLRLLYPAVCWLLSAGEPHVLLWIMPAVNLACVGALAGLGAWLAGRQHWSPWWGLTLPLALNMGTPLLRNLTDPLAALACAGLLIGWLCEAGPLALGGCALAALLGREQNLVLVGIVGLAALCSGKGRAAAALATACLLWACWLAGLWLAYGQAPLIPAHVMLEAPLSGMIYCWQQEIPAASQISCRMTFWYVASLLHLKLLIGLAVYGSLRPGSKVVRLTMLAGAALALVAGEMIYADFWSFTRVFTWLPLGLWLSGLTANSRGRVCCLLPATLWPLAAALLHV